MFSGQHTTTSPFPLQAISKGLSKKYIEHQLEERGLFFGAQIKTCSFDGHVLLIESVVSGFACQSRSRFFPAGSRNYHLFLNAKRNKSITMTYKGILNPVGESAEIVGAFKFNVDAKELIKNSMPFHFCVFAISQTLVTLIAYHQLPANTPVMTALLKAVISPFFTDLAGYALFLLALFFVFCLPTIIFHYWALRRAVLKFADILINDTSIYLNYTYTLQNDGR